MAIRKTSDCNGCPECIGCSLGKYRNAVFCDSCRHEIEDKVYIVEDMHLCEECALETLVQFDVEELVGND
ncbi:MAG: hypothetical protein IJN11_10340 [Oscillospiraceae bacterium]|nr:hypothetical protein [Oscillospiraceae bacterium]